MGESNSRLDEAPPVEPAPASDAPSPVTPQWVAAAASAPTPGHTIRVLPVRPQPKNILPPAMDDDTEDSHVAVAEDHHTEPGPSPTDTSLIQRNARDGTATVPSAAPGSICSLLEGVKSFDFFAFKNLLGEGGMGMVFNARQESMGREVALKTLHNDSLRDPVRLDVFEREALTTGALSHPNIVPVHFYGRDDKGRPFMVMKRVQGRPWSQMLHPNEASDKPRRPDEPENEMRQHLEIFLKVCDAMAFAHANKVVHRDLKPANVMVGEYGEVMVMDWGLALNLNAVTGKPKPSGIDEDTTLAGTPAYMAPEMVNCDLAAIGPRTDVYLLGGILHEIVTGLPPHHAQTVMGALEKAKIGNVSRIQPRPGFDRGTRDMERIIRTAMAVQPAHRYTDVAALQADIRAFLAGQGERQESECLALLARQDLTKLTREVATLAVTSPYYPRCTEIIAKSQQALTLWGFNPRAMRIRQEALALFAELAIRGQDWGLAESVIRDLKLTGTGGQTMASPLEMRLKSKRSDLRVKEFSERRAMRIAAIGAVFMAALCIYLYWRLRAAEDRALRSPRTVTLGADAKSEKNGGTEEPVVPPEATFAPRRGAAVALPGFGAPVQRLLVGTNDRVVAIDDSGRAWLWSLNSTAAPVRIATPKDVGLTTATWMDGGKLAIATTDGNVLAGDLRDDGIADWYIIHQKATAPIRSVVRHPSGRAWLLGFDGIVAFTGAGQLPEPLEFKGALLHLAIDPSSNIAAVGRSSVRSWRARGQGIDIPLGSQIIQSAFATSAKRLVYSTQNRDVSSGAILSCELHLAEGTHEIGQLHRFAKGEVTALAVSATGSTVLAGSSAGEMALISPDTAKRVQLTGQPLQTPIRAVALNADATTAYAVDAKGFLHAWNITRSTP